MATDHNFRVKNGLEVGGVLIVNSSGQLRVADITANQKFHDNIKLRFGNSSDLQIYHDGSHSYIDEQGTGRLYIKASSHITFMNSAENKVYANFAENGAVGLRYNNATKFETTNTGASITGNLGVSGDINLTGDLNITGDVNSVSVTDLDVLDKTITVGQGQSASNSTGSGLVVSGSNANMLWDNSDDRWEFNKDVYSDKFITGNVQLYASGDDNHLHIDAPTAIIGPSTTTSSNPSLGTSAYRFDGVFSSTGSFSGDVAVAGDLLVNGADNNNGKADFAVDAGGSHSQLSLYGAQVQAGGTDMNYNAKFFHDANGGQITVWDNNLTFSINGSNTGSATARDIIFKPQVSSTGVATERMRIKGDGNVGIGHTAPPDLLTIMGDGKYIASHDGTNYAFKLGADSSGDGNFMLHDSSGNVKVKLYAESGAHNYIQNGGSFGLGTSSPQDRLNIHDGSSSANLGIKITRGSQTHGLRLGVNDSHAFLWTSEAQNLVFATSGTQRMAVLSGGQIAINANSARTTGGTARLTIADSTTMINMGPSNSDNMYIRRMGAGLFQMQTYNNNNTGHIELEPYGGKVGIGTAGTAPSATLHVQNTSTNSEVMRLTTTGDDPDRNMYFQSDHIYSNGNFYLGDGGHRNLYRGSYHTFHYGSSNTEMMRLINGNVGINETVPDSRLHITGTDGGWDKHITIEHNSSDIGKILVDTDGMKFRNMSSGNGFYFRDNSNATQMFIKSDGNVGIGTTNPIQKLQVAGSIYSNGGQFFLDSGNKLIWGNSQQWIQTSNNGQMKFIVNNGERLYIQTDGRIETRMKKHFRIDDVGNLGTTIRYYKIATVNKGNSGITIKGTFNNHVESYGTGKFDLAIFGREDNSSGNISVTGTVDVSSPNSGVRIVKQSGGSGYINYDVYLVVRKYAHVDVEATIHGNSNGTGNMVDWHGNNTYVTTAPTGAAIELNTATLAAGHYKVTDSVISDAILDIPAAPSITSTSVVNETIELIFAQSATTGVDHYEVHSDGATGSDYSLIAIIPPEDIASSMSVVDSSFDDSGTVAYRVYAVKNGVYSSPSTTTRSFTMPSLDVSSMSVVPDTNTYHIQYNLPSTRFLDHVEIYVDAEASNSNLNRSGASLIYSGNNPSFKYNISSNDMEKYHQFWVECVSV